MFAHPASSPTNLRRKSGSLPLQRQGFKQDHDFAGFNQGINETVHVSCELQHYRERATPGSITKEKAYFEEHYKKIVATKAEQEMP
ncbi:hypothetical protein DITRI_Ditri16bG0090000 [Diplodiscus trichospermus]